MTAKVEIPAGEESWASAWLDALAFIFGLALAWRFQWETRDLVWSLWLSSFVIGYAMIVWGIFGRVTVGAVKSWMAQRSQPATDPSLNAGVGAMVLLAGGLFLLGFFTVHFSGFHYVHSVFLEAFFPIDVGHKMNSPGLDLYKEVFRRYWWFLPAAAIAERQAFRLKPAVLMPPATSVKPSDIAARRAMNNMGNGDMMTPYKNVIRMHLLIFFFAFTHFAKLDNFAVYAVVYAVYFFPWRLVKRKKVAVAAVG